MQARSSVFRSMLGAGMQEGETGVITISDMQPNVFEALLHFVYTDELPDDLQVLARSPLCCLLSIPGGSMPDPALCSGSYICNAVGSTVHPE